MEQLNIENKIQRAELNDLVVKYQDMLIRIAYQYFGNIYDSQDVVQNVFLKLVVKLRSFSSEDSMKAWLIRVTINCCKDELRAARRKVISINEINADISHSDAQINDFISSQPVINSIMRLPYKYRNVIYLHYYEGYSLNEIAQILEKSPNTVQSWHRRAKKILSMCPVMNDEKG